MEASKWGMMRSHGFGTWSIALTEDSGCCRISSYCASRYTDLKIIPCKTPSAEGSHHDGSRGSENIVYSIRSFRACIMVTANGIGTTTMYKVVTCQPG